MCRTYKDNGNLATPQSVGAYLRLCSRTGKHKGTRLLLTRLEWYPRSLRCACQPAILRERIGSLRKDG